MSATAQKAKRRLIPSGGNDNIQTPKWLAEAVVNHFNPSGAALEPCRGDGAFYEALKSGRCSCVDWCEIQDGRDFMDVSVSCKYDYVVTNPPWSRFRDFLKKSMEVSDNVIFVASINAWFYRARMRDLREGGFGIVEICHLDTPEEFPSSGLALAATWVRCGWKGGVTITRLESTNTRIQGRADKTERTET
jgi:hypothetical protein